MTFYNDSVFRLRPTTRENRAAETVLVYAGLRDTLGVERTAVHVRPVAQTETVAEDRETALSEWLVQTAPGSGDWDLLPTDWLRLPGGIIATVVGDPARPSDPISGQLSHVQVRVRRAQG